MDTRQKIIDLTRAAQIASDLKRNGARIRIVTGYFDVLTPDHARRFHALADGQPLIALVLDSSDALLGARARAELAAALAVVDYVVSLDGAAVEQALAMIQPDEIVREELADRQRSQALIEHVHRRQRG